MDDIVSRLRGLAKEYWQHRHYYEEAADEIIRLRAEITSMADEILWFRGENEKLKKQCNELHAANGDMVHIIAKIEAENDRLRAALKVAYVAILDGGWNDSQQDIIEAALEIEST